MSKPEKVRLQSTSAHSAKFLSDVVIKPGKTTRLVFRPEIIENPNNPAASVKGTLVHQRIGRKDTWENAESLPLSKVIKGTEVRWHLRSEVVLALFEELKALYKVADTDGVPRGTREYVRPSESLADLASLTDDELRDLLDANRTLGRKTMAGLLRWAASPDASEVLGEWMDSLDLSELARLRGSLGLTSLRTGIATWKSKRGSDDEELWQETFTSNFFLLSQLFSYPVVLIKGKACVGGVTEEDSGRKLVDFLIKNDVTDSATLIEIKTPATSLVGGHYRDGIWKMSTELNGAVIQALTYKQSLAEHYASLTLGRTPDYYVFNPHCVVIIGDAESELAGEPDKRRSFELFRRGIMGVEIVTFDELFERTARLVRLLEGKTDVARDEEEV